MFKSIPQSLKTWPNAIGLVTFVLGLAALLDAYVWQPLAMKNEWARLARKEAQLAQFMGGAVGVPPEQAQTFPNLEEVLKANRKSQYVFEIGNRLGIPFWENETLVQSGSLKDPPNYNSYATAAVVYMQRAKAYESYNLGLPPEANWAEIYLAKYRVIAAQSRSLPDKTPLESIFEWDLDHGRLPGKLRWDSAFDPEGYRKQLVQEHSLPDIPLRQIYKNLITPGKGNGYNPRTSARAAILQEEYRVASARLRGLPDTATKEQIEKWDREFAAARPK